MKQLSIDDHRKTYFAQVIVPVPIPTTFTYRIPRDFEPLIDVGFRVIVPFGHQKVLTGIVKELHLKAPTKYEAKYVLDILDDSPIISNHQVQLMEWIAEYYMSTMGEVMNNMLPTGLKLNSESRVQLHPDYEVDTSEYELTDREQVIVNNLQNDETLSYKEIGQLLNLKNIFKIIKSLVAKEVVLIFEKVNEKYKPKKEVRVRLNPQYLQDKNLQNLFEKLQNKPKQSNLVLKYLRDIDVLTSAHLNDNGISKKLLLQEGGSPSSLNTLIKNEVFESYERIVSRFDFLPDDRVPHPKLTDIQEKAKNEILEGFLSDKNVLLHGVTGSGKTAVYIDLIQETIDNGHQVLYLLPEIGLTTQIVARLRKHFGKDMGVYHSKYSDNERVEVWVGVLSGKFPLVVGVRSAVFLPFDNLGLVIIDEEHDTSYKQNQFSPRYHARDVALYLAAKQHARVLMGTATPSFESFYLSKEKKYKLVSITERFGEASMPEVVLIDMIKARKKKSVANDFAHELIHKVREHIDKKEQVIIFQNRRGYAPQVNCEHCGWVPQCEHCAVSLTYHLYKNELHCHYCNFKQAVPKQCQSCNSYDIKHVGYGTEKIEESLQLLLPDVNIQRMDLETTRNKYSYERIITAFDQGEIDILVGTQMVTKGLDFDKVSLVGVLDIDRMLYFPDFRAFERTYQLATQVSGRAGRKDKKGTVIIQTNQPNHSVLSYIKRNDYYALYEKEIEERKQYNYPPFTRIIKVIIKNKNKSICYETAHKLANLLVEQLGREQILGPQEPTINRIRNMYLMNIIIKINRYTTTLNPIKSTIRDQAIEVLAMHQLKNSKIIFDVDPC